MRPLIKVSLWHRRWSLVWWALGVSAFVALELGVYSSIKSQAQQLNDALKHLPSSVRSLFGANTDLFSPVGYLSSRLFYLLLPLLLSILAIGWGSSLLAKEEEEGTLELILGRPVSRSRLLSAKFFSGLFMTALIAAVATAVTLVMVKVVDLPVPLTYIAFAGLMAGLLSLAFGALAFMVAASGRAGRGAAIGIASLIGLGSYIVSSLEPNVHWLLWPARCLPYHYYNPTEILNGHYTWIPAAAYAGGSLILFMLAWRLFRRRDLGV